MQGNPLPVSTPMSSFQHYTQMTRPSNPYQTLSQPLFGNVIWVQGDAGAKSFFLPPNAPPTILLDSESDHMYLKSSDPSGMPTLKRFFYQEDMMEGSPEAEIAKAKKETNDLRSELKSLREEISDLRNKQNETLIIKEEPRYVPGQRIQVQQPQHTVPADVYRQNPQYVTGQPVGQ